MFSGYGHEGIVSYQFVVVKDMGSSAPDDRLEREGNLNKVDVSSTVAK